MTDAEKKIAEIKEALQKATPGPWKEEGTEIWRRGESYESRTYPHVWVADVVKNENAHLIANAPEWLRFLLDELEKITEQRDAYYKSAQFAEAAAHGIEKLREENRKMIEALQWYADEQNYDGSEFRLSETEKDTGQRARDILHEIGVTVEWQKSANDMRTTR